MKLRPDEIARLTDEGLGLECRMQEDAARQKTISKLLTDHALQVPDEHEPLNDGSREGTQWLAHGSDGTVVPIVCTSDLLVASLTEGTPAFDALVQIPTNPLPLFFRPTRKWEPLQSDGRKFRALVRETHPDPERVISACVRRNKDGIPVSVIKVEWSR